MFDVFGPVKELLSLDPVCIDNNIFRLHYKVSSKSPTKKTAQTVLYITLRARQVIDDDSRVIQCLCWANLCHTLKVEHLRPAY